VHRLSRDQTMYRILRKVKKSAAEFTGIILHGRLSSDPLGELTARSQTQWPNLNFSCLRLSLLGALTRVGPTTLLLIFHSLHSVVSFCLFFCVFFCFASTVHIELHSEVTSLQKHSGVARIVEGFHSFTRIPMRYPVWVLGLRIDPLRSLGRMS